MKEEKGSFDFLMGNIRKTINEFVSDLFVKEKPKERDKQEPVIEEGIKDLVEALNNHGLETFASCEGHKDGCYKYVAFKLPKGVNINVEKDSVSIHWFDE